MFKLLLSQITGVQAAKNAYVKMHINWNDIPELSGPASDYCKIL
jgi:hypothetical protein